jgi:hypothetical protein
MLLHVEKHFASLKPQSPGPMELRRDRPEPAVQSPVALQPDGKGWQRR